MLHELFDSPLALPPWAIDEYAVRRLTGTNEAPTDEEDSAIRLSISTLQAQLNLPSGVFDDTGTRCLDASEIQALIDRRRAVNSPFRKLPTELICLILVEVYDTHDFGVARHGVLTPPHPLWHLSHISRFWRAAANACPQLWTNVSIEIVDPSPSAMELHNPLEKLETQYARAANLPVHMALTAWPLSKSLDRQWMAGFLAGSHRWTTLYVRCGTAQFDQLRPLAEPGRLPRLRSLALHSLEASRPPQGVSEVFAHAPQLNKIDLTTFACDSPSPLLALPWKAITAYRGAYHARLHLELFSRCSNLTTAVLGFVAIPTLTVDELPPSYQNLSPLKSRVIAHKLQNLTLNAPGHFLFDALDAPVLDVLALRGSVQRLSLLTFLQRVPATRLDSGIPNGNALTTLIWDHVHLYTGNEATYDSLVLPPTALLQTMPSLRRLVLRVPQRQQLSFGRAERQELIAGLRTPMEAYPLLAVLEIEDPFYAQPQEKKFQLELLAAVCVRARERSNIFTVLRLALGSRAAFPLGANAVSAAMDNVRVFRDGGMLGALQVEVLSQLDMAEFTNY
ncbi:hypothetical protein C8F01DRAFT_1121379 [Mycena amicta]|nr:hypothetical protein C8F01DRAFT_1121379 [Mycena amicta]